MSIALLLLPAAMALVFGLEMPGLNVPGFEAKEYWHVLVAVAISAAAFIRAKILPPMVKQPSELAIDSHWAYRAHKHDSLQEVRVLKLGVEHPHRAFVAMEEEGEETWAPIDRLKCPWEDLARFHLNHCGL